MSERQIAELSQYRTSDAFDALEKLVLDYATAMTSTDVEDDLVSALREHLNDAQLVELTACIAWENYRARFNHALRIEADGFVEGAACALPAPTTVEA
jgi:alkylhydroperoxidase family enzyme